MYNNVIKLVSEQSKIDEAGDTVKTFKERTVFADLRSIGQTEFYQAQASRLKPEIKFVLPDYLEYKGEKMLKYQAFDSDEELEYTVIRTYRNGNELEMVCERGVDKNVDT